MASKGLFFIGEQTAQVEMMTGVLRRTLGHGAQMLLAEFTLAAGSGGGAPATSSAGMAASSPAACVSIAPWSSDPGSGTNRFPIPLMTMSRRIEAKKAPTNLLT